MTGRGIDQILTSPSDPSIHEGYLQSAIDYIDIAERASGPIPRAVEPFYIWGEALEQIERVTPHVRIVNLETAVTRSDDWESKGINYRMNPANVGCLSAARIDCCALANNHVLDWGVSGLLETVDTLHAAGIKTAGAGRSRAEAWSPAEIALPGAGRLLVFSFATETSGVPPRWAAEHDAGVALLPDLSERTVQHISEIVHACKRPRDLAIASLHWGPNWGYEISVGEARFARALIEGAGIDLIHGHSSHHAKAIELFQGKLILYGCGDLINDYEGIAGHDAFRSDLGVMYFPTLDAATGCVVALELAVMQRKRFRLQRAAGADARWLAGVLARESARFGIALTSHPDGRITIN